MTTRTSATSTTITTVPVSMLVVFAIAVVWVSNTTSSFTVMASLLAPDNGSLPRIMVEYNNVKFVREATEKFAVDGQIRNLIDSHRTEEGTTDGSPGLPLDGNNRKNRILTIVINNVTMMEQIRESPYVNNVELDQRMETMVYSKRPRYVSLNTNTNNCNVDNNSNEKEEQKLELEFLNLISTVRRTTTTGTKTNNENDENEEDEETGREEKKKGVDARKLRIFQSRDEGERIPYGISMVQAPELWPIQQKNRFIDVCVVDTGYNAGHEDLPTITAKQVGGTTTSAGVWFNDGNGHGTHCAGTIGAVGNNDVGVVGIREKPTLNQFHIGKGLADDGSGFSSNVMTAVQGCIDDGAKVISLSLGGTEYNRIEKNFYDDVYNQGILVIAAAGNAGNSGLLYPAAYPSVIAVAAVDADGIRPAFSQCNDQVEIAAPGVDIMSTYPPNSYAVLSGTSMAGPHVAGIAAQLMAFFPECMNYQIRNAMLRSAAHVGEYPGRCNNGYGSGLVQGMEAYNLLSIRGCEGAGGPVVLNPAKNEAKGGCEQNRDYTAFGNTTYRNVCPGKQLMSSATSFVVTTGGTTMKHCATVMMLIGTVVASTFSVL